MKTQMHAYIDALAAKYKYRPLPREIRNAAYDYYNRYLNGFDKITRKTVSIGGTVFCNSYTRIVVGDYGAYLEIEPDAIMVPLTVPRTQMWRQDAEYIQRHNLSIKYRWFEYNGVKVYQQISTVKYADYKPDKFYVSVVDFDEE